MKRDNYSQIASGMIIGLCTDVYSRTDGVIGALLFSLGLLSICCTQLPLFTGKIGNSNKYQFLAETLFFNLIGVATMFVLLHYLGYVSLGIGCGFLMQIGVTCYKRNFVITLLCVMAFILAGYKHCIAMFYTNSLDLGLWIQVLIGNIIGAKVAYFMGVKNGN